MSLVSRTALTFLAGLVAVPMTSVTHTNPSGSAVARQATPIAYDATQKEAYLAPAALDYIRPGLNLKIVSVTNVAPGQNPVVEILMTDDLGGPLDRTGVLTPGTIEVDFILAQWNASNYEYINLTTSSFGPGLVYPLHDTGGTWTDVTVGDSKYTFATKLPATFDVTQTVSLGVYGARSTAVRIHKRSACSRDGNPRTILSSSFHG